MSNIQKVLYGLTIIATIIYLGWRLFFTLPIGDSWYALLFGVLLLVSEMVSSFTAGILIWSKHKAKEIKKPEIKEEQFPDVDVFIATHNEEVDLLYKTVNACVNMRYPDKSKVHIYLADDTDRQEVAELAKKFGVGHLGLTGNQHAKSGNLNHAMAKTSSPLIATFDADMIPYSHFLLETVPYFVSQDEDKPLGFVQTPQSFYNPDLFQFNFFSESNIPNEQDFFSREVNVLNNAHDAAVYTGSNTVLLRQAIDDAGGFPTDTVTEDFELGALINGKGYRSISTLEPMASGLTPTDIPSMFKQRIRWARGVVRSIHNIKVLTNKDLTFSQQLVFLNSYFYWWSFIRRIIYIMAPVMFTVFDTRVVATDIWQLFIFWLPSYILLHLSMRQVSSDIRTQSWGEVQETIFAPYMIIPVFLETIGIKEQKFKVTSKTTKQSSKEKWLMLPHLILLVLCVIGFIKFNYNKYGSEIFYGSILSFWLIIHMFNLTFAILFFLGRPIYRKEERFAMPMPMEVQRVSASEADGSLTSDAPRHQVEVVDVSENGLSFRTAFPIYFPSTERIEFNMMREDYHVNLTGKVIRVTEQKRTWLYGIALDEMSEKTYQTYLQIIHDGYNRSLPMFRDSWVTPLDRLANILKQRLRSKIKTQPSNINIGTTPVLRLNERIQMDDYDILLTSFDYNTLTIFSLEELHVQEAFELTIYGVSFVLSLKERVGNDYQFNIDNLEQLLRSNELQILIESWLIREDVDAHDYVTN